MARTIAVGVDGSIPGRVALRWAMRHAIATEAEVLVVYVVSPDFASLGSLSDDELRAEGERLLEGEADYARARVPGPTVRTRLMQGNAMRQLIVVSRQVEMVVVGTHKTGFIRGRVFGSRSIVLAAGSRTPVAVIPDSSGRNRSGIFVGVDDSEASHAAVQFGAMEAVRTGQPLRLVSAWRLPEPSRGESHPDQDRVHEAYMRAILDNQAERVRSDYPDAEVHVRLVRLSPAEALVDASASAALVVLGNSGPVSDGQGLLGSVTHDVLVNLAGPTVVVHAALADAL
jgi:nucleotide-binding universal stress UspA family protein